MHHTVTEEPGLCLLAEGLLVDQDKGRKERGKGWERKRRERKGVERRREARIVETWKEKLEDQAAESRLVYDEAAALVNWSFCLLL